ncbi:MAG: D-2-hydroxyacid dehydrogenase [Nitrolancea sp.]
MPKLTKLVLGFELEQPYVERIRTTYPDVEVVVCTERAKLPEMMDGAQALIGWGLNADLMQNHPELRWFATGGAGVDGVLFPELIESDLILTNNSGVHAPHMAEYLLGMMLGFVRGLPELMRAQTRHEWRGRDGLTVYELGRQTLAVVGLGDIGQALAWRANAIGMRVIGSRRHPGEAPRGVERIYAPEALHDMLSEADHVAITLPLTDETRGLFGSAEFAVMKPTSFIYNIGRGAIIDSDALMSALNGGQIAGAGLDVTDPEPLPADSPLWDMEDVVITAHTSGRGPFYWERGIELLVENIGRFMRDEPMLNVVDKKAGY